MFYQARCTTLSEHGMHADRPCNARRHLGTQDFSPVWSIAMTRRRCVYSRRKRTRTLVEDEYHRGEQGIQVYF